MTTVSFSVVEGAGFLHVEQKLNEVKLSVPNPLADLLTEVNNSDSPLKYQESVLKRLPAALPGEM